MKTKKFIALTIAVLTITMAFAPAAMAETYAPFSWDLWTLQKKTSYDYRYTLAIQQFMNLNEGRTLKIDGIYGSNTYDAVKQFQNHNSYLTVDGIVGSNTWSSMSAYLLNDSHYYGYDEEFWHQMVDSAGLYSDNKYGDYHVFNSNVSNITSHCYYRYGQSNRWLVYTKLGDYNSNASWIWYYIYS